MAQTTIQSCYKNPAELVLFHDVEMRFNLSTTYRGVVGFARLDEDLVRVIESEGTPLGDD
jgi:hypothetical protein